MKVLQRKLNQNLLTMQSSKHIAKKMPYQSGALSKVIRSPVDGWVKERWEA